MHPCAPVGIAIRGTGILALCLWSAAARGGQPEVGEPLGREALAICRSTDLVPAVDRAGVLARGLSRAEEAVQADPQDAAAHFAIFCSLGKGLMNRTGWRLFGALGDLRRARKELDLALALAPDYPGALAAKGSMLVQLPRLLGGDPDEGVRLAQSAVALAPDDPTVRLMLASVLQAVGQRDAARENASIALGILERAGPANELASARIFVASVQ
jgi:tetratricopeptide (TPR) repeat protein